MDSITAYLPPAEGFLPKWLLFVSIVSIGNSIQAYTSLGPTQKVYAGSSSSGSVAKSSSSTKTTTSPVTPLSARTFGTWTALSSIVRLYAAYNVENKAVYEIAFWTYLIAFGHFYSEWLLFGTMRLGKGLAGPAVVSVVTLVWMVLQKDFYVK